MPEKQAELKLLGWVHEQPWTGSGHLAEVLTPPGSRGENLGPLQTGNWKRHSPRKLETCTGNLERSTHQHRASTGSSSVSVCLLGGEKIVLKFYRDKPVLTQV